MPKYNVTVWLGTHTVAVEAGNEDDAMLAAEQMIGDRVWMDATYEVTEQIGLNEGFIGEAS